MMKRGGHRYMGMQLGISSFWYETIELGFYNTREQGGEIRLFISSGRFIIPSIELSVRFRDLFALQYLRVKGCSSTRDRRREPSHLPGG